MLKNKLFILINVLGMGVAIACCIVAFLAYEYDSTFDAIHANRQSVYRVSVDREFENTITHVGYSPLPLGEVVGKTFQDVDKSTRFYLSHSNFKRENDLFPSNLSYVDPDFFNMFSFTFISGKPGDIKDRTSIFISESMAIRLFNTTAEAFGKTITQVYGNTMKEGKIAGIYKDPPMNSSLFREDGSAYMNFENFKDEYSDIREDDWKKESTLFVQINDINNVTGVQKQLQPYIANNNKVREDFQIRTFTLDPLSTMAYTDRTSEARIATWAAPPSAAIIGSVIMAGLILLIACFNLTNTSIAISSRRLKEIGLRKVMGSRRAQLIAQFVGETTCICLLALIVSFGMADFFVAGWNVMTVYIQLTPDYLDNPAFMSFIAGVLIFTGIIAGSYPAFYISKFQPVNILKGKVKFGGTNYFTRTLLGLQFAFSLIAIVSAVGFLQNAEYQRQYDLGFDVRGSIIAWVQDEAEFNTYRNALQQNPQVLSVAGASSGIFSNHTHEPIKHESRQIEVDIIGVGDNYLSTMDLELMTGRDFIRDSETDERESVIITEKLADLYGWDNPIGKEIIYKDTEKLFVVGVVKDVYTQGLWRELDPMIIRYVLPKHYNQLIVSTAAGNVTEVNTFMKEQWATLFPTRLYNGEMLVTNLQRIDHLNLSISYMYAFLGLICLALSATGLFTLVSLNVIKRMKEIGVRKVLGASVFNITRIVNTEFIIILTIASVLGASASYNSTNIIMSSIWKYYQGVNVTTFVVAIGLLFTVSLITIGYKVFNVANMNPVNTLRDE